MITADNLIELMVKARVYKWKIPTENRWLVYESMPEEGEGVKKNLGSFASEDAADEFLDDYRAMLTQHVESLIEVKNTVGKRRVEAPTPMKIRKSKRCSSVPSISKPPDSNPTSTES